MYIFQIAFLYYDKNLPKKLQVLKDNRNPILILDNKSVSMFGTSLHSVDINGDDFSELIVGAPGFSQIDGGYENGAIYLYEGGGPVSYIFILSNKAILKYLNNINYPNHISMIFYSTENKIM